MKINIYYIEDINGLKYVGSTKESLRRRLSRHRWRKYKEQKYTCSSRLLDLNNSKIYLLEECEEEERNEAEQYYIQNIDCVNIIKNIGNHNSTNYNTWFCSWAEKQDSHNLHKINPDLFA